MSDYIEREVPWDDQYISKTDAIKLAAIIVVPFATSENIQDIHKAFERTIDKYPAADVVHVPEGGIGELSDGYHTFNGLYYQRMVLFAALVRQNKDKAWKSLRHEDGELCFGGGWFIVGIDTPDGSYTYHYEDNFWSMFDCQELPVAKHWDGHTEKDVTRLLSLPDVQPVKHGEWKFDPLGGDWECLVCGYHSMEHGNYCPNCGADMRGE